MGNYYQEIVWESGAPNNNTCYENGTHVHYSIPSDSWYNNQAYVGYGSGGSYSESAFRFKNVTIPPGSTITSAVLNMRMYEYSSGTLNYILYGIAQDDTALLTSNVFGGVRPQTSASVNWDLADAPYTSPYSQRYDSPDISSIIQEIVNRGGWASGNALAIEIQSRFSGAQGDTNLGTADNQGTPPEFGARLTITYVTGGSASVSPSSSASSSASPSVSPSVSSSASSSPSPSPMPPAIPAVLKIGKPGVNVLTNSDIEHLKFSSEYGTLKYSSKQTSNIQIDASAGDIAAHGTITHNLNKYPFVEVFVSVYIGSPTGVYEYCPFLGAGASVFYKANVKITKTTIELYAEINGVSSSLWHFDFLVFIFNNDLNL